MATDNYTTCGQQQLVAFDKLDECLLLDECTKQQQKQQQQQMPMPTEFNISVQPSTVEFFYEKFNDTKVNSDATLKNKYV